MITPDVTPEAIRRELRRLGFAEGDTAGPAGATWFNRDDPDGLAVIVPRERDRAVRGYQATIAEAVQRLVWITDSTLDGVLSRLRAQHDRLELRILHELTVDHGLPVTKAPSVMAGFVNLIKNGARTHFVGARAIHRGFPGASYQEALESIQVLAPQAGSFRLVAVSVEQPQTSTGHSSLSKSRDALTATLRSLAALSAEDRSAEELEAGDVETLVDAGVSRQLLNAMQLLTLSATSGLRLEFSASWDHALGRPDAPDAPVFICDHHLALAKGLKKRLEAYAPEPGYRLSGWAETAEAQGRSLEGFPAGTVVVRTKLNGRYRDVLVELSKSVFREVKPGISDVEMTGTLERIAGRWHLTSPRGVRISTPAPERTRDEELRLELENRDAG